MLYEVITIRSALNSVIELINSFYSGAFELEWIPLMTGRPKAVITSYSIHYTKLYDNPTLENLCDYFKTMLSRILGGNGWLLTKIEMSETPSRSYIIDRADEIEKIIKGEMLADNSNLKIDSEAEKIANKILS